MTRKQVSSLNRTVQNHTSVPVPHPSWLGEIPNGPKISAQEFWKRLGL
ncbi:hypothetical protein [Caenibius tardaugens]|nr:hypothetical protein [Caenibius tardaugens]